MSFCSNCHAEYIAGELYCMTCGEPLPAPITWRLPVHPEAAAAAGTRQNDKQQEANTEAAHPARLLRLRLQLASGVIIDLKGREMAIVGREDGGVTPDVDLAPHGGVEQGVSRQHAMILLKENRYYIQDLKSTNETMLNASRLHPEQLYELSNNDILQFGELVARVLL